MIQKTILLISILLINQPCKAQQTFIQRADFVEPRQGAFSFVLNNKFYTGTGSDESGTSNNKMFMFDIALNSWSQLNDFPTQPVRNGISMVINDTAYAGFGWDGVNTTGWYQYNASTDTWTLKNSLCNVGAFAGTFSLNGKGYAACGSDSAGAKNELWEYNPALDLWTQKTSFPAAARYLPFADTVNGFAYVGLGDSFFIQPFFSDMYKYDEQNDSWSSIAPIPNSSTGAIAQGECSFHASWNGKIILMSITGIVTSNTNDYNTIYIYDPAGDTWTLYENANLIGARGIPLTAQDGSKAYYGAGFDYWGDVMKDFWEVDLNNLITSVEISNPYLKNITVTANSHNISIKIPNELLANGNFELDLHSVDGKKLESFRLTGNDCLNADNFSDGTYIYIVRSDNRTLKSGKIIVY